jgi:hypothetical protein
MANRHLEESHDWIPLFPLMETILRKAKGNEGCVVIESLFEYAAGNIDTADRMKKKVRKCLWKYIDDYRYIIDQCYEVTEYAEQDY